MPLDTLAANRRALSTDGMNKLSKTETEKSAAAPGGKGAGRGAENPTITKLFFEVVRSEGLEPPRFYSLPPQGSASTNSATSAWDTGWKDLGPAGSTAPM